MSKSPRPKRPPSYCRHKASGRAYVQFGGRKGRPIYLGEYGSTESRAEYARLIAEWTRTGAEPSAPPSPTRSSGGLTVAELLARYWRHVESYYVKNGKPTSEVECIRNALKYLRRLYGHTPANDFGPLALETVQAAMIEAGHVRTAINRHIRRVKGLFSWAVRKELVRADLHHALQAVPGLKRDRSAARESDPVLPVADADVDAIKPFVSRQVWAMVELQRITAMRSGEVVQMRPCDIDLSGDVWEYRPASHKSEHHGRGRVVYLPRSAQAVLGPFLANRATSAFLFSPIEAESERRAAMHRARKTPLSYGNSPGTNCKRNPKRRPHERYTPDTYRVAIARACKRAKIARWHPHQLRHSAATNIRKLFGLEAAQVWLGHASADVTQVYAERDAELARSVAARMDGGAA